MNLSGHSIIGYGEGSSTPGTFTAFNPADNQPLEPLFHAASPEEVAQAAELAWTAFAVYKDIAGVAKAAFMRLAADRIDAQVDALVERATLETGLPEARIRMETGRTTNQLRLFASLVEEGSWVDARIENAMPERQPLPKADIRSMLRPVGPVLVFGASNFPLAFSVAGGDTASALAAGCPVIVKAHHSHPGTAEIVGRAVQSAARDSGMPEGVFSVLFGGGRSVGMTLVRHPRVKAVGFTGSTTGGRALFDAAAARPEPIPVYAEMGSINPVFVLPEAMSSRGEEIAIGLHASLTLGVGQFCTNPGLILAGKGAAFRNKLAELVNATSPGCMLNEGIHKAYNEGLALLETKARVATVGMAVETIEVGSFAQAAVFETDANTFRIDESLREEIFGPANLIVRTDTVEEMMEIATNLDGHLTASLFGTEKDLEEYSALISVLETKVGRVIVNQYPTGVEVCHAMVHGGPYPATTDGRSTSVGTAAILRFARPVCFQNFPQPLLPEALKDDNPLGLMRMIDGELKR